MKGILSFPSEKSVVKEGGIEFLQILRVSIDDFFAKEGSEVEVKKAIAEGHYLCLDFANNSNNGASFEVEALVSDTVVLTYIGSIGF